MGFSPGEMSIGCMVDESLLIPIIWLGTFCVHVHKYTHQIQSLLCSAFDLLQAHSS